MAYKKNEGNLEVRLLVFSNMQLKVNTLTDTLHE